MVNCSNGIVPHYFQWSQLKDPIITRGLSLKEDYIGFDSYANDYGYTGGDTNDYVPNEDDYADNLFSPSLPATSWRGNVAVQDQYSMSNAPSDTMKPFVDADKQNLGEEIAIEDCDREIQLSDGSWFYFVYKDMNASRCMCHYSNYKDPELMPGYDCSIVSSRGKRHLLTVPDQDYKDGYSCKPSLTVKGASSTQVFIYKKLIWEKHLLLYL